MDFWTQMNQKPEVKAVISKHYQNFRVACKKIIEEGISQGAFKEVDASAYSLFVVASIDGMSLQWLFGHDSCNYDKLIQKSCHWLLEGVQKEVAA